jgi:hypothetical protein
MSSPTESPKVEPASKDQRKSSPPRTPSQVKPSCSHVASCHCRSRLEVRDDKCPTIGASSKACAIDDRRHTRLLQYGTQPILAGTQRLRAVLHRRQRQRRDTRRPYYPATRRKPHVSLTAPWHHARLAVVARRPFEPCYAQRTHWTDRLLQRIVQRLPHP